MAMATQSEGKYKLLSHDSSYCLPLFSYFRIVFGDSFGKHVISEITKLPFDIAQSVMIIF